MRRLQLLFWCALLLSGAAAAQFTTVTGTVTDPNGLPYAFGTIASTIVSSNTPMITSISQPYFQPTQATGLDGTGTFAVRLGDTTQISPGGSTWTFKVCSSAGTVQPAFGKGPVCFVVTGISISGAAQNIGAILTAAAPALTANFGTASTSPGVTPQNIAGAFAVWGGTPVATGPPASGLATAAGAGSTDINPTATFPAGKNYFVAAVGSANTVVGVINGQNGNNSLFPVLAWYRFSVRLGIGNLTNARYWLGLGTFNIGSGVGANSTAILNTAKFATDTPNSNLLGFRFSAGTDTHWQACSVIAGGAQTCVDTGVTPDTNGATNATQPHLYEMVPSTAGALVNFYIDGVLVTPLGISSLPSITPANAADALVDMFWTGDNKNTATAVNATFYSMQMILKP